jgi:hypothetical protein
MNHIIDLNIRISTFSPNESKHITKIVNVQFIPVIFPFTCIRRFSTRKNLNVLLWVEPFYLLICFVGCFPQKKKKRKKKRRRKRCVFVISVDPDRKIILLCRTSKVNSVSHPIFIKG